MSPKGSPVHPVTSQLGHEHPSPQALVNQADRTPGPGQLGTLLEPGLSRRLDHLWSDASAKVATDVGQAALHGLVLTVDEMGGELGQHERVVAKHSVRPEVGGQQSNR